MVFGLNKLVELCINKRGDASIAAGGIGFARGPTDVSIIVKSHLPGRSVDITYNWTASILRGIWELTTVYGYYTVELEVYIGKLDTENFRGYATLYPGTMASNITLGSNGQLFTDNH